MDFQKAWAMTAHNKKNISETTHDINNAIYLLNIWTQNRNAHSTEYSRYLLSNYSKLKESKLKGLNSYVVWTHICGFNNDRMYVVVFNSDYFLKRTIAIRWMCRERRQLKRENFPTKPNLNKLFPISALIKDANVSIRLLPMGAFIVIYIQILLNYTRRCSRYIGIFFWYDTVYTVYLPAFMHLLKRKKKSLRNK